MDVGFGHARRPLRRRAWLCFLVRCSLLLVRHPCLGLVWQFRRKPENDGDVRSRRWLCTRRDRNVLTVPCEKTRPFFVSGIWCSWLSHPLSMVLTAGGLRFESGFVHFFFSSVSILNLLISKETNRLAILCNCFECSSKTFLAYGTASHTNTTCFHPMNMRSFFGRF